MLSRARGTLKGDLEIPEHRTVIFGLVDGSLRVGLTTLRRCRRLGSLETSGVYLMDAQACEVDGPAEVLIGDEGGAAVVKIDDVLIILDQNFLGQRAPQKNSQWLESFIVGLDGGNPSLTGE